jgi:small subunit ribosomal protein S35
MSGSIRGYGMKLQGSLSRSNVCSGSSSRQFSSSTVVQAKPRRQKTTQDPFALDKMKKFEFDDIPTAGHFMLERKRQLLHYARLAEWEMPKLSQFKKTYKPPTNEQILRVKQIHYQGEAHPVTRKAVITIRIADLFKGDYLSSRDAKKKFLLLAGPRWNPFEEKTDVSNPVKKTSNDFDLFGDHSEIERKVLDQGGLGVVKISCERFPNSQMNLKWCSDVVDSLIAESNKDSSSVKDVPLDLRHAQAQERSRANLDKKSAPSLRDFPKEWLQKSSSA